MSLGKLLIPALGYVAAFLGVVMISCNVSKEDEDIVIYPDRIVAIDGATNQCREWDPKKQEFVGEPLNASVCIGKPKDE